MFRSEVFWNRIEIKLRTVILKHYNVIYYCVSLCTCNSLQFNSIGFNRTMSWNIMWTGMKVVQSPLSFHTYLQWKTCFNNTGNLCRCGFDCWATPTSTTCTKCSGLCYSAAWFPICLCAKEKGDKSLNLIPPSNLSRHLLAVARNDCTCIRSFAKFPSYLLSSMSSIL